LSVRCGEATGTIGFFKIQQQGYQFNFHCRLISSNHWLL